MFFVSKINILPKSVADLIAAGEVVERPASAIKEMMENAIDAGCKKLTVEIQNGGIRYIRITDDGSGIAREDVRAAFISHATSKLARAEDLHEIHTLGFRGEALASIAAVAKVEMLTKTAEEDFGTRYVIEGGEEKLLDDAGCPDGTTIAVRDLFYNTPARMKFLKKDATEGNYVSDMVTKTAMANPAVSIRLIRDGKQTLFTPGDGKLLSVITAVQGREFADNLIVCDYTLNGVTIEGFVSLPRAGRATRASQYFFVNSRYVRIPMAASALDQAYKNAIMVGKFPSCVINIKIPPAAVDVNVHPAKTEVRFADEKRIFEAIYYAVKSAITQNDVRPQLHLDTALAPKPDTGEQVSLTFAEKIPAAKNADAAEPNRMSEPGEQGVNPPVSRLSPPVTRADSPKVTVYSPEEEVFVTACSPSVQETVSPEEPAASDKETIAAQAQEEPAEGFAKASAVSQDKTNISENINTNSPLAELPYFTYLGEAFKTYLIAESGDKLLLIDKHALHERILFNEIKARGACTAPQTLMLPESVHLDRREYAAITENINALEQIGFALEDFGEGCVMIRACPMMFAEDSLPEVISELADAFLSHKRDLITNKLDWLYHSASCRAAVKAGKALSDDDAQLLIRRVLSDDSLRYCPHGRPVLIELTRKELEKQFGRIQ